MTAELAREVENLERLFDQGQTDLGRLMQAQQRLIQLRNAEVDAIWAATQAQADLLLALGAPALIQGMLNQAESAATTPAPVSSPTPIPSPVSHLTPARFNNFSLPASRAPKPRLNRRSIVKRPGIRSISACGSHSSATRSQAAARYLVRSSPSRLES